MLGKNLIKAAAGNAAEAVVTDEYFNQTTLLLHGDGTNGAQNNTFLDSSTNNFTITRNGNTTQGTFSPFSVAEGQWSNYFDGTSDYLQAASNADFQFGTGEFVIEGWYYFTGASANYTPLFSNGTFSAGVMVRFGTNSDLYINGTQRTWTGTTGTFPFNSWNHVCLVRTSTTVSLFINGTRVLTATDSANISPTSAFTICDQTHSLGSGFTGYVNNFRTIKGDDGPYDATQTTITVPTAPFTANTTNQVLLTCYSNRFIDANTATTAKTITANGNVAVQPFSPFAPSAAYSTSVNGGSGYFDGSGDYLTFANGNDFAFGTGDFTVELWVYANGSSTTHGLVASQSTGGTFWASLIASGTIYWQSVNGSTNLVSTSFAGYYNQWTHIAFVRSSGTTTIYLNGVAKASAADSTNYASNTGNIDIGRDLDNSASLTGWASNVRIVKGTAVYTSAFTPPTAPLTAVSGTELLCNFTNAGIFDNTGKNNLETVGNAQIDTSVKKYGTGSMEFDGTGDVLTMKETGGIFTFGTGDYTYECWIYTTTGATTQKTIFGRANTGNVAVPYIYLVNSTGVLSLYYSATVVSSTTAIAQNTWTHIAVCRASGTSRLFINGVLDGSAADTTSLISPDILTIGGSGVAAANPFIGYIDDLRITKGVARYTAAFTPPTAAFPDL